MSTLIRPHIPRGSEPSRDDDVTGVRALLSALPEPDPMPEHLVERINASLTAAQAERAAEMSAAPVTPLIARGHGRRPGRRRVFAIAGAAAAVVMVTVVGSTILSAPQPTAVNDSATIAGASRAQEGSSAAAPKAADKAGSAPAAGQATTPSLVLIGRSGTRYTRADFATQARALRSAPTGSIRPETAGSSNGPGPGPAATTSGLMECLSAIGATGAQMVRADVAFYQGRPAVIIVATTNGIPVAYAVGGQCSHNDAAVLRPATPLP